MRKTLSITAAFLLSSTPAWTADLTLERVFQSPALQGAAPRLPKLSPDGRLATLLRNRSEDRDRYDLWAVDTATGQARMLVDSEKLGTGAELSEEEKMRRERLRIAGTKGITAYSWAPDGRSILVPLDGDLYLASLDGSARRLTNTKETEIDAQVSKTGRFLSFVRNQNLFVIDVGSGQERPLTTEGGGTISWGSAEFVSQEEIGRSEGHWWSPNDRFVAVARVDESPVQVVTRAAIGAEGTRLYEQRYPVAGSANALVDLYVLAPGGGQKVKVDLGSDPDIYLARVDWSKDGKSLYVQRQSRDQKKLDLLRVDPVTGKSTLLFSESSKSWINLNDNLKPLADGSLLWSSERSGHSHLYRWKGGKWTQLTRGNWEVADVEGVDERARRIYFTGAYDHPDEQHLYWVSLDKPGKPVRVTEAGWHTSQVDMDEGAARALVFRSNPSHPSQVYLSDAAGKRLAWVEENKLDAAHPYAPFLDSHVAPCLRNAQGRGRQDGNPLQDALAAAGAGEALPGLRASLCGTFGWADHPRLGAGHAAPPVSRRQRLDRLLSGWPGDASTRPGVRRQLYLTLGGVEVADQLAGAEWLKRQDYVDPARIAVFGWSYGGYMTLKLLQAAQGTYAAGVSGAPVTRWELYDTHYTERYLGNPATDPKPYEAASALNDAAKMSDPLLIIHGMADDNVVFENTTALVAKLQEEKRPFEMMVYPGATHAITGEGRQTHMWKTIESFLDRSVKAKP
jgi:dipeptidyl-peptidase-4